MKPITRAAKPADFRGIQALLDYENRVHRHLDWRTPMDWLGTQPFTVLEVDNVIQAAFACPDDPPGVSWIRLFAALPHVDLRESWQHLLAATCQTITAPIQQIYSVAVKSWFTMLLLESNFKLHQTIVVLHRNIPFSCPDDDKKGIQIRRMKPDDLEEVTKVDQSSFEKLWQNSLQGTKFAFNESSYATVVLAADQIVGYQISSNTQINAHLARIAVLPEMQGRGIATSLTRNLLHHYSRRGIGYITVNTQNDNEASLKLYEKMGFERSGDRFPVLQLDIK